MRAGGIGFDPTDAPPFLVDVDRELVADVALVQVRHVRQTARTLVAHAIEQPVLHLVFQAVGHHNAHHRLGGVRRRPPCVLIGRGIVDVRLDRPTSRSSRGSIRQRAGRS